ncbi:MAG: hypothetical protein ABIG20_02970 [archaeon]
MDQSIFLKVVGNNPETRVLDFFLDNEIYDYSKSHIARSANISRVTLEPILKRILKIGIVKQTRNSGASKMYQIDRKNEIAKKLIDFDIELSFLFAPKIPVEVTAKTK